MINFTDEMDKDFEMARKMFRQSFGVEPSNTQLQGFLLNIFKNQDIDIKRKPKSKNLLIKWI